MFCRQQGHCSLAKSYFSLCLSSPDCLPEAHRLAQHCHLQGGQGQGPGKGQGQGKGQERNEEQETRSSRRERSRVVEGEEGGQILRREMDPRGLKVDLPPDFLLILISS